MRKNIIFLCLCFISLNSFSQYKMSVIGKTAIKTHESCKLIAYWDSNGYSIGYGHHGKDVKAGQKITKKQADAYFEKDVLWVNDAINRLIKELPVQHRFSQWFIDGLADMVYNCGENGVRTSPF